MKSLLENAKEIGFLLIGVSFLTCAISYHTNSKREEHNYKLIQLGDMVRNQHLIDTKTGKIWNKVCTGKFKDLTCDGLIVWDEMYVEGVTPADSPLAQFYYALRDESMKE